MTTDGKKLLVLGASGFIGKQAVLTALQQGWETIAVVRDPEAARDLANAGAHILKSDASTPTAWAGALAGCDVLLDLLQPKLPSRIGVKEIQRVAEQRLAWTRLLLDALLSIPPTQLLPSMLNSDSAELSDRALAARSAANGRADARQAARAGRRPGGGH